MKPVLWLGLPLIVLSLAVAGCGGADTGKSESSAPAAHSGEDAEIKANLAKLPSVEDRTIAQAQKLCPISNEPLGSMGVPVKVMLEDQPVFLCCKSCDKRAKDNPAKTLARAKEFKAKGPSQ